MSHEKPEAREESFSALGRITKPQGNRGEVRLQPYDLSPEFIMRARGVQWWVTLARDKEPIPFMVDDLRVRKKQIICKFHGVESISDAEKLRDSEVFIRDEDRPPLAEDEYYDDDLVGMKVVAKSNGADLGVVREVQRVAGQDLLVVENEKGRFLIPAVKEIVQSVDLQKREVRVDLPDGLDALNSEK